MYARHRRWIAKCAVVLLFAVVVASRAVSDAQNNFRFSILGDRTGGAVPGIYERVWREIDLLHPDFVINVGDTIEGGDDARAPGEWLALRPLWKRYAHYPLYFTPGNHDIWSDVSQNLYEKEAGRPINYGFNVQNAHFTVLDNSRTPELSDVQLRFLENDLKANQDRQPRFVFFHRPFWILPLKLRSGNFPLHAMVRKYGVSHVICGHGHQFVRLPRDGVVYLEVGSSGGSIDRGTNAGQGFAQGWFFHHVWGTVQGTKVDFSVKEIDGLKGKGRLFRAEDWGENGPVFDPADPAQR